MFVDTPGLVDGDMNYPFDVDDAIVLLGKHAYVRTYVWYMYVYALHVRVCIRTYVCKAFVSLCSSQLIFREVTYVYSHIL